MSEVKYTKVSTVDRLPNQSDIYSTNLGDIDFHVHDGNFWDADDNFEMYPEYWLEPVPDREEEMREMLQRIHSALTELRDTDENSEIFRSIIPEEIEQLLNELKPN